MSVLADAISLPGEIYRKIRNRLELLTVVPVVEFVSRVWYHLDPRVYSEQRRIGAVTQGEAPLKGKGFVLFLLASRPPLPAFTQDALEAIARSGLNLIIVYNGKLSDSQRQTLLPHAHVIMERVNLGRDFGGYKDGISYLLKHFPDMDRLALMNDSVFFFKPGLDKLFADLSGPHDFIGLTEVIEHHYHVQSFMLSFGRAVIEHPNFQRYWRRYRPISTRRWAIHKGEVGLTRLVTKSGFKPHILYHGSQLIPYLRSERPEEILALAKLLPKAFRERLIRNFRAVDADTKINTLASVEGVSRAIQTLSSDEDIEADLLQIRDESISSIRRISRSIESVEALKTEGLLSAIITSVTERNQVHVGGFLFVKYLGLPVLKRDIFYRELYGMEDIYDFLTQMDEPLIEEIIADLRQKGTAKNFKGFKKVLYRHGVI
ncbi:MAG TPA: rhamnan synthesis F family protein [Xanthobacteraceae bacterium]|nr:rhamnan synthesis F family protein [Xanthobacteraceae bacterium]